MQLFDADNFGLLKPHRVAGFDRPIPAICYRGDALKSPFPIGGIATGYFELRGDGTLGLSSIYNSYVPPMQLGGALLTLVGKDGTQTPLDAKHADIFVLAHFPVCNVKFAVKDGGPVVWLRVFTPLLPGDAETSNTPGAVFAMQVEGGFDGDIRINLALGHNVEPGAKPLELSKEVTGVARQYFKGDDYRGSLALGWIDGLEGRATATDDKATLTLTGPIKPG